MTKDDDVPTSPISTPRSWMATAGADSPSTLSEFQEGLPVRLIATPRAAFNTCCPSEALSSVVARNKDEFDFFPVVEPAQETQGRIIGLLNVVPLMRNPECGGLVRDRMDSLSEDNLIGADASLLTFVRGAHRQGCCLVVSGREISGLVTISDLQRLPVRASLFAMVTHLEMIMADAIRREFPDADSWFVHLSDSRRAKIDDEVSNARAGDSFVEKLLFTQFGDKRDIIRKSNLVRGSKAAYKRDMKHIKKLRDALAHANSYANSRELAYDTCRTVILIDHWIEQLSQPLAN